MSGAGAISVAVQAFMRDIATAGLLSDEQVRQIWFSLDPDGRPSTAEAFERELVAAGLLTEFQGSALLNGRSGELLLADYLILDKIGAGGMGQVFLARDRSTHDMVALKTLSRHRLESDHAIERFRREVLAITRLDHQNIVTAYDVGRDGQTYFFTMEYLDGQDLSTLVNANGPLSIAEAVGYICQAAIGLEYAHGQGVIHRDVKPSNLFLDETGTVKVLDLGLARLVEGIEDEHSSGFTNAIIGTANFISPEQVRDTHDVDARSDIYSLGCTLYWLLTRRPPFPRRTQLQQLLAHESAEIPSLHASRKDVGKDLDDVFRKMMAKDPDDRQQSMNEVVSELSIAASYDVATNNKSSASDHPLNVFIEERKATSIMAADPSDRSDDTSTDFSSTIVSPSRSDFDRARESRDTSSRRKIIVGFALLVGITLIAIGYKSWRGGSEPIPSPPVGHHVELRPRETLSARTGMTSSLSFSRDGRLLAAAEGSALRIWDVRQRVGQPPIKGHRARISTVAFHPSGQAVATGSHDGTVRIWNPTTGEQQRQYSGDHGQIQCLTYSSDGRLAWGCDSGTVLLWDPEGEDEPRQLAGSESGLLAIEFVDDKLVAAGWDNNIHVWDIKTFEHVRLQGHLHPITGLGYLPKGQLLVSSSSTPDLSEIRLWNLQESSQTRYVPFGFEIRKLCVLPTRGLAALATKVGEWAKVQLVDTESWMSEDLTRSESDIANLASSSDDRLLGVCRWDGVVQVWDLAARVLASEFHGSCNACLSVSFSPNDSTLVSAGRGGSIKLWDSHQTQEIATLRNVHTQDVRSVSFSHDGTRFASGSFDARLVVWDRDTQDAILSLDRRSGVPGPIFDVDFSPDDSKIVVAGGRGGGFVSLVDLDTKTIEATSMGHGSIVSSVCYSPNGRLIATGSHDYTVRLWNVGEDTEARVFREHRHWVNCVAFSPDGRWLASAGQDHLIIRDLKDDEARQLIGHRGEVSQIVFSTDGRFLFSTGSDQTIRVWDTENGSELAQVSKRDADTTCLSISGDDQTLATGRSDGSLDLWIFSADALQPSN